MEKPLRALPPFHEKEFSRLIRVWLQTAQNGRVVIEWSISTGPHVFVYGAGDRSTGICLAEGLTGEENDERWADFLENEHIPRLVAQLGQEGLHPQPICVDLRPIQVQRARRRAIFAHAGH